MHRFSARSVQPSRPRSRGRRLWAACLAAAMAAGQGGCTGAPTSSPAGDGGGPDVAQPQERTIAFVTNQIADFWNIAKAGCEDAAKDFGVQVEVKMPPEATVVEQKRIVEDLLTAGIDAIAISPLDAENQTEFLNRVAQSVPLITHDSDAPQCDRLMYIGMDNYKAGRMCGELVKQALPEGGQVMIFIGRLEQNNSKYRRQGVIDELLDRPPDRGRFDPVDQKIEGEKYTILGTLTDQGKHEVAQEKAADAINTYPEMNAMVGLFEYNPPAIYQALSQAGKLGQVKIIGFDENDLTLQAIKDGHCTGTVVQDPYQYGYRSVEKLLAYLQEGPAAIPADKYVDIPPRKITQENVDEFWADLRAKRGG